MMTDQEIRDVFDKASDMVIEAIQNGMDFDATLKQTGVDSGFSFFARVFNPEPLGESTLPD